MGRQRRMGYPLLADGHYLQGVLPALAEGCCRSYFRSAHERILNLMGHSPCVDGSSAAKVRPVGAERELAVHAEGSGGGWVGRVMAVGDPILFYVGH
jgi:hypothetical protein